VVQALNLDSPDSARTYSEAERDTLTSHLVELQQAVNEGKFSHLPFDTRVLCAFHGNIFRDVRGHAGRVRSQTFGQERLEFGGHPSLHRTEVESALRAVFQKVEAQIQDVLSNPEHEHYDKRAMRVAVWAHAELVRIHPFEDGNGRTARMISDYILIRLDMDPVPIAAVKNEYYVAMEAYILRRDESLLVDLYLRLSVEE